MAEGMHWVAKDLTPNYLSAATRSTGWAPQRGTVSLTAISHRASPHPSVPLPGGPDHLGEGLPGVEGRFPGKAEHPLADAVALHLVGAGGDGDHAPIQVVEGRFVGSVVAGPPRQRLGAADLDGDPRPDRGIRARCKLAVGGD